MIAYKVVYHKRNKYSSAFIGGFAKVTYLKEKENFPPDWLAEKGYGICCFETLRQAKRFAITNNTPIIWKVKGTKIPLQPHANMIELEEERKITTSKFLFPKGTIMLKSVTFIEELL